MLYELKNSKILAGGTDLVLKLRNSKSNYIENLIDITSIKELKSITKTNINYIIVSLITFTEALLDKYPNADKEKINEYMSRNLCRCTGYAKIIEAVIKLKIKLEMTRFNRKEY